MKKPELSIAIYKLLISKEESLEGRIEREENPEIQQQLVSFKDEMRFSLGRDYNDLGIAYSRTGNKDLSKNYILKAYDEDVKHQKRYQAALMPAYRNLSSILIWEAEIFLSRQEYFPSFLMAWISAELSLRRLWVKLLFERGYSKEKKEWLGRLDIGVIIENLFLLGKVTTEKSDIDTFRGRRNGIIHATGATPTRGEVQRVIKLAYQLHSKG